jgi:nucleoside 2-deoxyribosyltransferase
MIRVYVAGPYSADNVIDVLKNIGKGQRVCGELFAGGFAPFCPWHDKTFITDFPDEPFNVQDFYDYSMAWLEVSDCVLVLDGWHHSEGTMAEMSRAFDIGIPVFDSVDMLVAWAAEVQNG